MRRRIAVVLAAFSLTLAGCGQQTLVPGLPPGFYPSALAYDAARDRYLVGSFETGEVAVLDRSGRRLGSLRAGKPGERVLRMRIQGRTLWIALSDALEAVELDAPLAPRRVYRLQASVRYADIDADTGGRLYVLDAHHRALLVFDPERRAAQRIADLPGGNEAAPARCAPSGVPQTRTQGALLVMPDGRTLLAALDDRMYRVDAHAGTVAEVPLRAPLTYVTQLFYHGAADGRHEVLAVRGEASRITRLQWDASFSQVFAQESFRTVAGAPIVAAYDGNALRMLLGSLHHHPLYCGDGRPNVPLRLAEYRPAAAEPPRWMIAERTPD